MPKYYGCPCEGCGKPLTLQDDIVVCPDCGAPYHRDCYEKLGRCIHAPAHAAGYEWKFPYQESELCTCPACGERTLRSESVCRCCGAALPPEGAQEPADRTDSDEHSEEFDYSTFYRQFQETGAPQVDPLRQTCMASGSTARVPLRRSAASVRSSRTRHSAKPCSARRAAPAGPPCSAVWSCSWSLAAHSPCCWVPMWMP